MKRKFLMKGIYENLIFVNKILQNNTGITHKRKSCSQYGSFPLTATVVDFTFCSFNITYELNCVAGISVYHRYTS